MNRFCYLIPFDPEPVSRSFACQSKRAEVEAILELVCTRLSGEMPVVDVDEGPDLGSRSPAFWLFPEELGAKLHLYGVVESNPRRVYPIAATSVDHHDDVVAFIDDLSANLPAKFRPASWY